ncbi:hypothetical protein EHS25_000872 [Saitozyma podzolica]|uniref:Rhodopsin domain-containing protein n=1 Tax=Saitozyma podzolica TaxID=1890683 RepID=A0A427YXG9_9TREE|nr:hypothetical protein EHS25_000872 [Saitozyma podzolica]
MEVLNNRGTNVFVVTLVLIILATIFIVLRLISKWGLTRKATSDDFVAIISWLFAIGLLILPQWENPFERSIYAFTIFYNLAIMAAKTAMLILYQHMATAHPFLRYASLFVMAVVNIAGIVLIILDIFQYHPIPAAFNEIDGTCGKVILVATFIVGGFVTIVDVVRIVYLQGALKEERQINPSASITATTRPAELHLPSELLPHVVCRRGPGHARHAQAAARAPRTPSPERDARVAPRLRHQGFAILRRGPIRRVAHVASVTDDVPEQPTDAEDGMMDFYDMRASESRPEARRIPGSSCPSAAARRGAD